MRAGIYVAIVLAGAPAHADGRAHAKQLYEQGLAHYNAAEYADAIAAWKQAYQIEPSPILLFNIGQAYRLSGDCAQATTYYDNYTREAPTAPNHDELEQARALCKSQPATVEAPPPPVVETKPSPPPVVETPRAAITVDQPPTPAHTQRTIGIAVGAGGVALGIAAIGFAVLSSNDSNLLNHYSGTWTPTQADTQRAGQLDVTLAYTFGAIGAAAAIAGGVLFVLDRGASEHAVSVAPIHGGASLAWTRRF